MIASDYYHNIEYHGKCTLQVIGVVLCPHIHDNFNLFLNVANKFHVKENISC